MLKKISYFYILNILFSVSVLLFMSNTSAKTTNEENISNSVAFSATKFLSVEEAYKLNVAIKDNLLILDWTIAPGYYLYRDRFNFLDEKSEQLTVKPIFSTGQLIHDEYYNKNLEVYYGHTSFSIPLRELNQNIIIESQGCADAGLCYPIRRQVISIDSNKSIAYLKETPVEVFFSNPTDKNSRTLPTEEMEIIPILLMLMFAFLGGLALNLMPCVFPILSLKILNLANVNSSSNNKYLHGLAYAAGILICFSVIGSLLMILRNSGEAIGWGFQLQSPVFIGALVYLFIVMGLSFSGWLQIGNSVMNWGQHSTEGNNLSSSFMTGLLATIVASPCTAPFMGTALGLALTQPTFIALSAFVFLGLGMAFPILLITCLPSLSKWLPKPGAWMDNFKQFLAFPLYLTAVWLLWVLGRQTNSDVVSATLCGIIFILFTIWLHKKYKGGITKVIGLTMLFLAMLLPLWSEHNIGVKSGSWETYSKDKLNTLLRNEDSVFVNLTADWCITCLVNEKMVLNTENFSTLLKKNQITYLKADWTSYNPEITELLDTYNRSGVPLYLFYPSGKINPVILPQILTINKMIDELSKNLR